MLRWILLGIGVTIIVAIYFISRHRERAHDTRLEPALEDLDFAPLPNKEPDENLLQNLADIEIPKNNSPSENNLSAEKQPPEDQLIVLNLLANDAEGFQGEDFYSVMRQQGFKLNDKNIFHYDKEEYSLIAVNIFKPGHFTPSAEEFSTKGIALILELAKTINPTTAFEKMTQVANNLKVLLNARLCDEQRSSLTQQTLLYIEEQIAEYQARNTI